VNALEVRCPECGQPVDITGRSGLWHYPDHNRLAAKPVRGIRPAEPCPGSGQTLWQTKAAAA
jgi:hypothetical protein